VRGKRFMGVLLGTLNQFRTEIGKDTTQTEKRQEIDRKNAEKLELSRLETQEQIRKEREERLEKQEQKLKQAKAERYEKLKESFYKRYTDLSNFLKTETKPSLLYRPAQGLEKELEEHKEKTMKEYQEIEKRLYKEAFDGEKPKSVAEAIEEKIKREKEELKLKENKDFFGNDEMEVSE
jgi:hypothetical protein